MADFEERVREVDRFLGLLVDFERPGVELTYDGERGRDIVSLDAESLKTLKATSFLLLYNLVESAVRRALGALYETLRREGRTCGNVDADIRSVWIDQAVRKIDVHSATRKTYQNIARNLIEDVLRDAAIELDAETLPVSGTLDAEKVRTIWRMHGIPYDAHSGAFGGRELVTVMAQRNYLAHGDLSFRECGRQFTTDELDKIKEQVVLFMRSILGNMTGFIDDRAYGA